DRGNIQRGHPGNRTCPRCRRCRAPMTLCCLIPHRSPRQCQTFPSLLPAPGQRRLRPCVFLPWFAGRFPPFFAQAPPRTLLPLPFGDLPFLVLWLWFCCFGADFCAGFCPGLGFWPT